VIPKIEMRLKLSEILDLNVCFCGSQKCNQLPQYGENMEYNDKNSFFLLNNSKDSNLNEVWIAS